MSADDLTEIAGSFVMGERGLAEYTADAAPVSDDHPLMEYSKSIHYLSPQDPKIYDGMAEISDYLDETQLPFLKSHGPTQNYHRRHGAAFCSCR